ncbi:MAG TPA: arabinan endo-1,5-alpha-L-arabinosidase [Verrucomicrobiae bacterium]|nr:arabinan endo-1,5-alpha-L-arabinosidase [Verrucomicrobiae bacterium]
MKKSDAFWVLALVLLGAGCRAPATKITEEPKLLELSGDLNTHDPAIIKAHGTYYIFCTGGGWRRGVIPIHTSTNLLDWARGGFVFEHLPAWATNEIPLARGAWAPDISWFAGKYHIYYAVSSFGVNDSAIGLAVNETLDPASPDYKWVDEGMTVRSRAGVDDFNCIDPNIVIEDPRHIWLCWGSFWGGIKMRRIDPDTGKLSTNDTMLYSLASRPRLHPPQTPPVEGAIEAPTIIRHGNYWYLFASYDFCCRGTNSTYNVKVGRARNVTGPYVDRTGKRLTDDGGTTVVEAITPNWNGAGHEAVLQDDTEDYLVFHSYDKETGISRLEISTMVWENGWPRVGNGR